MNDLTKIDEKITVTILLVIMSVILIANVILGFCIGWDAYSTELAYITQNLKLIA
jgi:hypothetical protein